MIFLSLPGDILENLRVRVSDPWGKSAPRKIFKILFWLETSIKDSRKGYFSKCYFIARIALSFPEVLFCFLELSFCFSKVPLYFSKMSYCFPEFPFSFPEVTSCYLLCISFSKNAFFPGDCALSWSSSKLLREIIFTLLLFHFLLELFTDQLMLLSW